MWGRIYPHAVLLTLANIILRVSCKGSLTFVIDDTDSMSDDIRQVRSSVNRISNVVFNEKSSLIGNMVLVTFNDPDAQVRVVTDNRNTFKRSLDTVYAHNIYNPDCWEPSMNGLLLALEKSNSNSFIYVFTDAPAKDYQDGRYVKELCQKKQSQITFVLTGRCLDYHDSQAFNVYFDIAQACSGLAFDITKSDVKKVLPTIEEAIRGNKTVFVSRIIPAGVKKKIPFTIDDHTDYAIVSVSGRNVYLDIKGPLANIEKIMWEDNGKVAKLSNAKPGTYVATVMGQTKTSVVILGRTDFFFTHGFSELKPKSLGDTSLQPIADANVHLSISVTDDHHTVKIVSAQILDMNDNPMKSPVPLTEISKDFYVTEPFVAPSQMFKIAVNGIVKATGKSIKRIVKIPITAEEPPKIVPKVQGGTDIRVTKGQTAKIECKVIRGLPAPKITWLFGGKLGSTFTPLAGSESVLRITNVEGKHDGKYKCVATNAAGKDEQVTTLFVQELPIITTITSRVYLATEGDALLRIPCVATGVPKPVIVWKLSGRYITPSAKYFLKDGTLTIRNPKVSDTNSYTCEAKNEVGAVSATFKMYIRQAPQVSGVTAKKVKIGTPATIECTVKGEPKPIITWLFKDNSGSKFLRIAGSNKVLNIPKVENKHAGRYKCVAKNQVGNNEHITTLEVQDMPKIVSNVSTLYQSTEGDALMRIPCVTGGLPKPSITWKLNGHVINPSAKYSIEDGTLIIRHPKVSDTNSYTCEAKNEVGAVSATFKTYIRLVPKVQGGTEIKVTKGQTAIIECKVISGLPAPKITWLFGGKSGSTFTPLAGSESVLRITNVEGKHDGKYKCVATNAAGKDEHVTKLFVQELPIITTIPSRVYLATEGDALLRIPCVATGVPKPVIVWKLSGRYITPSAKYFLKDGSLIIRNPKVSDTNSYTCEAKNEVGAVRATFKMYIRQAPQVSGVTAKKVKIGTSASIECTVKGEPKPTITWLFKDNSGSKFLRIPGSNKVLNIPKVENKHAGRYKCVAKNQVGNNEHITTLEVQDMPKIVSNVSTIYQSTEGDALMRIPCVAGGLPKPSITWKLNGHVINPSAKYSIVDGTLIIKDPKVNDTNSYTCEAKNEVGAVSATFKTYIRLVPKVQQGGTEIMKVTKGQTAIIECKVISGLPAPNITWLFGDKSGSTFTPLAGSESVLRITNVEGKHDGKYKCVATNAAGKDEHVTTLFVQELPMITTITSMVYLATEGDALLRIPCVATGIPKPVIVWKLSGRYITSSAKYSIEDGTLIIRNPKVSDTNSYTCEAKNEVGAVSATFKTYIRQAPQISGVTVKKVKIGTSATIECTVKGEPKPIITWQFKDNSGSKFLRIPGSNKVLNIPKVENKHAGRYKCVAKNEVGNNEHITTLEVQDMPKIFSNVSTIYQSTEGDALMRIPCVAGGLPKPSITWKLNGHVINPSAKYSIVDGTLIIKDPKVNDTNSYTCEAKNEVGAVSATFKTYIRLVPKVQQGGTEIMKVTKGQTAIIECKVISGLPAPNITWLFGDKSGSTFTPLAGSESVLRITNVEGKHDGKYKCVATNAAGKDEHVTTLFVQELPMITTITSMVYLATEGDALLRIPCVATGIPKPVIVWKLSGRYITSSAKYSIEDGTLIIRNPKVSDTNSYTCEAKNEVGAVSATFKTYIRQAPQISGVTVKKVKIGTSATIECTVKGEPKPIITWQFKDNSGSKFLRIPGSNKVLNIPKVENKHAGRYKCVAKNEVGNNEHITTLEVQDMPKIFSNVSTIYQSTEGDALMRIPCVAGGLPKPSITWKLNGHVINPSAKYSIVDGTLIIKDPKVNDTNSYTCEAKNEVGAVSATFKTYIRLVPKVQQGGTEIMKVTKGQTAIIECKVISGLPAPNITWLFGDKSGSTFTPLAGSESVLRITNVEGKHDGKYKCVATNAAGKDEHVTTLFVQELPMITTITSMVYLATEGDALLRIPCVATGIPKPVIVWKLSGRYITSSAKYSIEDGTLIIRNPKVSDTNSYTCEAKNEVGAVSATFKTYIRQAPQISGVTVMKVKIGTSATIECTVKGEPKPIITWQFKDNSGSKFLRIPGSNKVLNIPKVENKHAGRYKCVAKNEVGNNEHITTLEVQDMPKIFSNVSTIYQSTEGDALMRIPCVAGGLPKPSITWKLNGHVINPSAKYSIVDGTLIIKDPKVNDTNSYTCEAKNEVGAVSATFKTYIRLVPKVQQGGTEIMKVTKGQTAIIECKVISGLPAPNITWLFGDKSGSTFTPLAGSESVLRITNVEGKHDGKYKCVATNAAGKDEHVTTLFVQELPMITTITSMVYLATEGDALLRIPCVATGIPKPVIVWKLSGRYITSSAKYSIEDGTLIIRNPKVSDTNSYTCEAKNEVGAVSATFKTYIRQAPQISGVTVKKVKIGTSATIECTVKGEPKPIITWQFKDNSGSKFLRIPGSNKVLNIPKVENKHAGRYKCVAKNEVGNNEHITTLEVQDMPKIFSNVSTIYQSTEGDALMRIPCVAGGLPKPSITWKLNGHVINPSAKYSIVDGTLIIKDPKVNDTNSYTCEAKNEVGAVSATFKTYIRLVPKVQQGGTEIMKVTKGQTAIIECKVISGLPAPNITWLFGDKSGSTFTPLAGSESVLRITNVEGKHDGKYKCVATNAAGKDEHVTTLFVQELPMITTITSMVYLATEGDALLRIPCVATGIPKPVIVWKLSGRYITSSAKYSIEDGTLIIRNPKVSDTNSYTCEAKNEVGAVSATFKTYIRQAPQISGVTVKKVKIGTSATIECTVKGEPKPIITWQFKDNSGSKFLRIPGSNKVLNIPKVENKHAGRYKCVAKNEVGNNEHITTLEVQDMPKIVSNVSTIYQSTEGDALMRIPCVAGGLPKPSITWKLNGHVINPSAKYSIVDGTLIIKDPKVNDTNSYTCEAKNEVGAVSATFKTYIRLVPKVQQGGTEIMKVTKGQTAIIECKVISGLPAPNITWLFGDKSGSTFTPLAGSESVLRITNVEGKHDGKYKCVATNAAGKDEHVTTLFVQELPMITTITSMVYLATEGDALLRIPCVATGIPKPVIVWKLSGRYITSSAKYSIEDGTLIIRNPKVSDTNSYTCEAKNEVGAVSATFKTYIRQAPQISGVTVKKVKIGTSATIECTVKGEPKPIITWQFKDNSGSKFLRIPGSNKVLNIPKVENKHAGRYKCVAKNEVGNNEHITTLEVQDMPKIVSNVSTIYQSTEGDALMRIPCVAGGLPKPSITWKLNGHVINPSAKYSIVDGTLIIKDPKVNDTNSYTCEAKNEVGAVSATFKTYIRLVPKVQQGGTEIMKVTKGQTAIIECKVISGLPAPNITWLFGDKSGSTFTPLAGSESVLRITNVEGKHDGKYKCVATNAAGKDEHVTTLFVQELPMITTITSMVYLATEGDALLRIPCVATGIPKPVIVWKLSGRYITSSAKYSIEDGTLIIRNPKVSDTNSYMCEAKNEVGAVSATFKTYIRQAPQISGVTVKKVKIGTSATIECTVKGEPKPIITWQFKDNSGSKFLRIPGSNKVLNIPKVENKHAGRYKCVAKNEVGNNEHITTLEVQDMPKIVSNVSTIYQSTEGDALMRIPCVAGGLPKPSITWKLNGHVINPSAKYSIVDGTLIIKDPKVNDTNSYTCEAKNEVGAVSATFKTYIRLVPKVQQGGTEIMKVTKGQTAIIECKVISGLPAPNITWLFGDKSGSTFTPLAGSESVLRITNVEGKHDGKYKCVATNAAGKDEHVTTLFVQELPMITTITSMVYLATEGDALLRIPCVATGIPKPVIVWKLSGRYITSSAKYSIEDGTLIIRNPKVSDTNSYMCEAKNEVGAVSATFKTYIRQAPQISGVTVKKVKIGTSATIECTVKGEPKPIITWQFKDNSGSKFLRIPGSNKVLNIPKVENKHAGRYKCVAKNEVGNNEHITTLEVQDMPKIVSNVSTIYQSTEGDALMRIPCVAGGLPKPSITWKLNGHVINPSAKYSIVDGTLIIKDPKVNDTNSYTCEAKNEVGAVSATFKTYIRLVPKVQQGGTEIMKVTKGQTAIIECKVISGLPAPNITWLFGDKSGSTFTPLAGSESVLRITNVEGKHDGKYKCVATNAAGKDEHVTTLFVQELPMITTITSMVYLATEGDALLRIPCVATGIPKPVIVWKLSGRYITSSAKYSIEDGTLIIRNPKVSDTNSYTCEAKNEVGAVSATFKTYIRQAPQISGVTVKKVKIGTSATIECTVKGEPKPIITWQFKDNSGSKFLRIPGSNKVLNIPKVENKHAGRYKCVAKNEVGNNEHITTLEVQDMPKIVSNVSTIYQSTEGDALMRIPCVAGGLPKPSITWKLNGHVINPSAKYSIVDGTLIIKDPKVNDTNSYTCEAKNEVGAVSATFKTYIRLVPKVQQGGTEIMKVTKGQTAIIECKVISGIPAPNITWLFGDKSGSTFTPLAGSESVLRITNVEGKHDGKYKCVATNAAGKDEHVTTLFVQELPMITTITSMVYLATEGDALLRIPCVATGIPKPVIVWKLSGRYITSSAKYSIEDGTLIIRNPKVSDTNSYTCEAKNEVGAVSATFKTYIRQAPQISGVTVKKVKIGTSATIECTVKGEPKPIITWQFKDNSGSKFLRIPGSNKVLNIPKVENKHAGRYKCVAKNEVGNNEHITTLEVQDMPKIVSNVSTIYQSTEGDALMRIPCVAGGLPKPSITWKLNGHVINPSAKYSIVDGTLIIKDPKVNDTNSYTCEAKNEVGAVSATFKTYIRLVPKVQQGGTEIMKVTKGQTAIIECKVISGLPAPNITWLFGDKSGSTFTPLAGSESVLRITNVEGKHDGKYKCVATNAAGKDEHVTTLFVQELPMITTITSMVYLATEGDALLRIPCVATGIPKPVIVWKLSGRYITSSAKYSIEDGTLIIRNPKVSDTNSYTCEAKNEVGAVSATFKTYIRQAPQISGVTVKKVKIGTSATIECTVKGEPKPIITWQFKDNSGSKFLRIPGSNKVLNIPKVENKHAGRYKCVAKNEVGNNEHITTLEVQDMPKIVSNVSTIYQSTEGDALMRIPCVAGGLPKPSITWKLNGHVINPSAKYSIEDGTLIIRNPKVSDTNSYTCEAKNEVGAVSATFKTYIRQAPQISGVTAKKVKIGTSASIECTVKGEPKPIITWQFKDNSGSKFLRIPGSNKVLNIPKVENKHAGRYKCVAKNEVGNNEHITTLEVQDMPRIVSNVSTIYQSTEGDALMRIPCVAGGLPKPSITWKLNSHVINPSAKYSIENGTLIIKDPKVSDTNSYTCEAKNEVGAVSATFNTYIRQLPKLSGVASKSVRLGTPASVECKIVKGEPKPKITWQFMEKSTSKYVLIAGSENTLRLSSAKKTHAGSYKCVATNDLGSDEHVTTLIVDFAPEIIKNSTTVEGIEGDLALRIPCDVVGIPKPVITWKLKGAAITPDSKYTIKDGALVIMKPTEKDSSQYTCEAKNYISTVSTTFQATVEKLPTNFGTEHFVYLKQGETKKLKCDAYSSASQSVKWFITKVRRRTPDSSLSTTPSPPELGSSDTRTASRKDYSSTPSPTITKDAGIKEPYIQIADASITDHDGNYTCRVSDKHGNTHTHTYVVDVGSAPEFVSDAYSLTDWQGVVSDITHNCDIRVNAKPKPVVEWTYNGKVLTDFNSAGLGHYTCNVSNAHGSVQKRFDVKSSACLISRNLWNARMQYMPLLLDDTGFWHNLKNTNHYTVVAEEGQIKMSCPSQKGTSNAFKKFPNKSTLEAYCYKEDSFLVEGNTYKLSDLQCTNSIQPSVIRKKEKCSTETSELIRVGYNVPGFLEAYEVCFDTEKNMPLYTRIIMTETNNNGLSAGYNWYTYPGVGIKKTERGFTCKDSMSSCCYSKSQLVNAIDFNDGPAKKSTFIDPLNVIPVWIPCDTSKTTWENINEMVRSQLPIYIDIVTWSGTHTLQEKNGAIIPRYLWKVVRFDEDEAVAIVHVNDPEPVEKDIKCKTQDICEKYDEWFISSDNYTYCCSLPDFFKSFDIHATDIGESMDTVQEKMKKST